MTNLVNLRKNHAEFKIYHRCYYFDELLERIREIRTSEKRFYQKVRDLFALSVDYDKTDQTTQTFFATVQNLLLYAVTGQTAAELIMARANPMEAEKSMLESVKRVAIPLIATIGFLYLSGVISAE